MFYLFICLNEREELSLPSKAEVLSSGEKLNSPKRNANQEMLKVRKYLKKKKKKLERLEEVKRVGSYKLESRISTLIRPLIVRSF